MILSAISVSGLSQVADSSIIKPTQKSAVSLSLGVATQGLGVLYSRNFNLSKNKPLVLTGKVGISSIILEPILNIPTSVAVGYGKKKRLSASVGFLIKRNFNATLKNKQDKIDYINDYPFSALGDIPALAWDYVFTSNIHYQHLLSKHIFWGVSTGLLIRLSFLGEPTWIWQRYYPALDLHLGYRF
jgi:hypothetical protein